MKHRAELLTNNSEGEMAMTWCLHVSSGRDLSLDLAIKSVRLLRASSSALARVAAFRRLRARKDAQPAAPNITEL